MKKNLFFLLFIVAACTLVLSCKKDKNESINEEVLPPGPPPFDVIGYWVGKYGPGDKEPNISYAFLLKPDSTIIVYGIDISDTTNADKAYGTWKYNSSTLTAHYAFSPQAAYSLIGTLVDSTFVGTWGHNLKNTGGGKYNAKLQE